MEKPVVLIVEDEAVIRMETVHAMEDAGYRVLQARDTSAALTFLESRHDIRAVFTEILVPGPLNGMELAQLIAKCWPRVRLIVTSSTPKPRNFPPAWRYIPKAYDGAKIVAALRTLLVPRLVLAA